MKSRGSSMPQDFQRVKLRDEYYYTEYVPGYAGLCFPKDVWEEFIDSMMFDVKVFQHPEWTCNEYEEWLALHFPTKVQPT